MRQTVVGVGTALTVVLLAARIGAQTCGDPSGGGIDVVDAANVLRAAVGLPSACTSAPKACNVDGQGTIDVIDAALVLRAAVGLPTALSCADPEITQFVNGVETAGGTPGVLDIGIAPVPGAPATITAVNGAAQAPAGGTNTVTVAFDTGGAAAAPAASDPGLLVAVRKSDATFAEGFFDVPLDTAAGEATVVVSFPKDLKKERFSLEFATRVGGVVSEYASLPQTPIPKRTPVPTPTSTPFCGNFRLDPGEQCDGFVGSCNFGCTNKCKCVAG